MISIGVIAASGKGGVVVYVYGSGSSAIHGIYTETGSYNGFPLYISQDGLIQIWNRGSQWAISDVGNFGTTAADCYFQERSSPEAFPWLVSLWKLGSFGTSPSPTVSLTPQSSPTSLDIDGGGNLFNLNLPRIGVFNGKSEYLGVADGKTFSVRWVDEIAAADRWVFMQEPSNMYFSSIENTDEPSEVVTWVREGIGTNPAPTFTEVY